MLDDDIQAIVSNMTSNGPKWKPNKLLSHLEKRKRQGQIPPDWTADDYNNWIIRIVTDDSTEIYRYWLPHFQKKYLVFGLPNWIVIVGDDGIMETAFEIDRQSYYEYLNPKAGFLRVK